MYTLQMVEQKHVAVRETLNQLHGYITSLLQQGWGFNFPGLKHFLRFHDENRHIFVNRH